MPKLEDHFSAADLQPRILRTRSRGQQGLVTLVPSRLAVENRLNEVYPNSWKTEFSALSRDPFVFICTLQVYPKGNVTWLSRDGLGSAAGLETAWDRAFVDAAGAYGVGRYLDGMTAWVDLKANGRPAPKPANILSMLNPDAGTTGGNDETITADQFEKLSAEAEEAGWQQSVFKTMVKQITGKEKARQITVGEMDNLRARLHTDSEHKSWHNKYGDG